MALRRNILATVAAATLLSMSVLSGLGQDPQKTTFSVSIVGGGPLVASLSLPPTFGFLNHNLDSEIGRSMQAGALLLTVLDMRGLASGWTILLATVDYRNHAGHIGADALVLSPGAISVQQGNPDLSGFFTFESTQMSTTSMPILSASPQRGDGEYDFALDGSLAFPDSPRIGMYTLLVTIQGTAP